MCLAVPGKIVECENDRAVVDLNGNRVRISTQLLEEVKVGDWVLLHAGFAIQKLDEEEAKKTWEVLKEMESYEQEQVEGVEVVGDQGGDSSEGNEK